MNRYLGFALAAAALLGCAVVAFFLFVERAEEYFHTEFYADTGITPMPGRPGDWRYGDREGHVTLVLSRGKPHSTVGSAHAWWQVVSLEWPSPPVPGKVDLRSGQVKVGYTSYLGSNEWTIGDKGVVGFVDIEAVEQDRIVAVYAIVVDAYNERWMPGHQHRQVWFEGRSVFERKPSPKTGKYAARGKLYPE